VGDFPEDVLKSLGLVVVTPDELICPLIEQHPDSMRWIHSQTLRYLPGSTDESTVEALKKAGLPRAALLIARLLAVDQDSTQATQAPQS
jgi:hypothetical protein